jgi:large subunit ribosomal protein L1
MMPIVGRVGQILRTKMPNPKAGTVSPNAAAVVTEIKNATRVEYRVDKAGIIHAPIGKVSYPAENLLANLTALVGALVKAKPSASKGKYLLNTTVSSSMGPGVKVDVALLQKMLEK